MNVPSLTLLSGLTHLPRDAPGNKSGGRAYNQSYYVDVKIINCAPGAKVNKINCILADGSAILMTMFTRKYNECRSVFISFNQGACLRISGFRVRLATDGYEVIVSDHGSKVIQIDPFVCQANGPHSADRVCMITGPPVPVLGNGPTANAGPIPPPIPQMMYFANPGDVPAPAPAPAALPPAPAPAPAPAVPGFHLPAPAPASGSSTPTAAELRERRMAAFSSTEKEGDSTGTKRSRDTAFSGSQDSLSSIESVDSLSQLLSSRSDLTVLLNMLVQQELAKKIATVEDDNGPAKRTKM